MKQRIAGFLFDWLVGAYLAVMLHRIVWQELLLGVDSALSSAPSNSGAVIAGIPVWLVYGAVGLVLAIAASISKVSIALLVQGKLERTMWQRTAALHIASLLLSLTFITGWVVTKISLVDMFSGERLRAAGRIFSNLLQPEFAILPQALSAIVETVYLAFMATVLALPASFVLAFLSARNLMRGNVWTRATYTFLRALTNFTRSIEPLVWAVIFTVWVKVGPFPGMLALMVHTISSLAKQYSEQIEDIDPGPMEAIASTGARPLQIVWFGVVPQVFIPFLSFTIYRWDINVRMATVIGLVGGGGIGTMLNQYQMLAQWREVGLIVLVIALVVWAMDYISARIREALA
ncbi:Phosphate-import permease protein PhnE [bacterium HR20]|jgi:phosphonate transport system permease protein|nr:Phosphate-import permease protein PhnE [bacterium HR20]